SGDPVNRIDATGRAPLPQISGFSYSIASKQVSLTYSQPGLETTAGPLEYYWDTSGFPYLDVTHAEIPRWDHNWQLDALSSQLRDIVRSLPPPPRLLPSPDPGRVTSGYGEIADAMLIWSG